MSEALSEEREQKLLNRINGLYKKAESTEFEEERNALIEQADRLVRQYALDAALADFQRSTEEQETVSTDIVEMGVDAGEWFQHALFILTLSARHNDVYPVILGGRRVHLIGFKQGIDFTHLLFAMLQIHFLRNIQPGWDPDKGLDENVFMLKEAGVKWRRIRDIAVANGHDIPWTERSQDGRRLIKAYRRHCEVLGVEPTNQTQNHREYREAFANAYVSRLRTRLSQLKNDYNPDDVAEGAALALRSRMDRVMDKVYEMYPDLHPDVRRRKEKEAEEEHAKWWNSLTPEEQKRYSRVPRAKQESEAAYRARMAGYNNGAAAANSVDLNPGGHDVSAPNRKAIR